MKLAAYYKSAKRRRVRVLVYTIFIFSFLLVVERSVTGCALFVMAGADVFEAELLETMIQKLVSFNKTKKGEKPIELEEPEIWYIIDRAIAELRKGKALVEFEAPVTMCGDTHGQFGDVLNLFKHGGWPPSMRYLFLGQIMNDFHQNFRYSSSFSGDYVDRGNNSIETICLMFLFKVRYPTNFFILRGKQMLQHES